MTELTAPDAIRLARFFHETYERLAPNYGYETREASRKPWDAVPEQNKRLMIAVCREVIDSFEKAAVDAIRLALKACEDLESSLVKNHVAVHPADVALMAKRKIIVAAKASGIQLEDK